MKLVSHLSSSIDRVQAYMAIEMTAIAFWVMAAYAESINGANTQLCTLRLYLPKA